LVTVPVLLHRSRGTSLSYDAPIMDLGKWDIPVTLTPVVMGAALCINIARHRQEVYDPDGSSLVLQYFAAIFVVVTLIAGFFAAAEPVGALVNADK
jgi:hypothetical protein